MLCARRTVLLHARRHHSFSSSHIRSDVARAEDLVAECRSRVKEAEEAEEAAVRDLQDVLRTTRSSQAHDSSARMEHRVAEETRRAVEAEMEPMRHRLSKMSRSLDKLLHKTERRQWHSERDFHHGERGGHSCHWRGRGRGGRRCFRRFIAFMLVAGLLYAYFNVDEEKCNKALKECKENHRRHGCPFARDAHTETK
eukprot:Rhum_TRINITY_DN13971_c0_g1::Rhum_TRINITY_DN13971_c0_g1_i3::g.66775::m.66775